MSAIKVIGSTIILSLTLAGFINAHSINSPWSPIPASDDTAEATEAVETIEKRFSILTADAFFDPASSVSAPGFQRQVCVELENSDYVAVLTGSDKKNYCLGDGTGNEVCQEFGRLVECRMAFFADNVSILDASSTAIEDISIPDTGVMCYKVTTAGSQYQGLYIAATYNWSETLAACLIYGDGPCETFATSYECESGLARWSGVDLLYDCDPSDQGAPQSWCNQVGMILSYYGDSSD
eukprot:CFRG1656T1